MKLKTITIDEQDFYLVPKCQTNTELDILIEPIGQKVKTIFYVNTRFMWGKEFDQKLIDGKDKYGGWWKYRREEWENGDFTWIRMFGGEVEAKKEDVIILESWYQKTIFSLSAVDEIDNNAFVKQPKKLSLLLNAGERSLYGILFDHQTMSKNEGFEMAFKYMCKNLNITDKTAQRIVNRLVELDLIEKVSGFSSRSTNSYKVKLEKIYEFDKMTNDEVFEFRDKLNKNTTVN